MPRPRSGGSVTTERIRASVPWSAETGRDIIVGDEPPEQSAGCCDVVCRQVRLAQRSHKALALPDRKWKCDQERGHQTKPAYFFAPFLPATVSAPQRT